MSRLLELRVRDFGLLRDARLECYAGFGALSGETGAGKSLCVAALRWALGGRVEGSAAGEGTAASAVFEPDPESVRLLADLGIRADELITLSREAGASGRSSCRVNGSLVSQASLRDLGEQLADVTTQGASQRMLRRSWQRRALDAAGGEAAALARAEVAAAHHRWRATEAALVEARAASHRSAAQLAEAEALIAELEPLNLREDEEEQLAAERSRLRNAAGIARAATRLADAASADEEGAAELLGRALVEVEALSAADRDLAELALQAASLVGTMRDLATASRRLADQVEVDPSRLDQVEERLDTIARVRRRHGSISNAIGALQGALRARDAAQGRLDVGALESEARAARIAAATAARALSAIRREAARRLERAVEQRLGLLELPLARFRVTLGVAADADGLDLGAGSVRCDTEGVDQVEFRLATTRGGVPLPLDEGPSGGELSRLALALAASAGEAEPLLVLDEVDTGVGGETAARVGDLLAEIGASRQVLALTHRPEIAARASWHLVVVRQEETAGPVGRVGRVQGQARVAEIARMMSGRHTAAALARAAELLVEGSPASRRAS
ncbi:MAG TPA: hypothetical protein VEK76_12530 [Candidatus Binatia bacterium]|nr:hypothetical protein [Candidatus Binatia bacterium]